MSAVSKIDKMYFVSQRDYEQTESDSSDDTEPNHTTFLLLVNSLVDDPGGQPFSWVYLRITFRHAFFISKTMGNVSDIIILLY